MGPDWLTLQSTAPCWVCGLWDAGNEETPCHQAAVRRPPAGRRLAVAPAAERVELGAHGQRGMGAGQDQDSENKKARDGLQSHFISSKTAAGVAPPLPKLRQARRAPATLFLNSNVISDCGANRSEGGTHGSDRGMSRAYCGTYVSD